MITKINHVAIAVENLDASAQTWQTLLGIRLSGRERVLSNKVEVGFIPVGESRLELVQPDAPDSPVAKFIEKRGPGLQHLCFEVDDLRAELARLRAAGVRLVNEEPAVGAHGYLVAFVHPAAAGGVLVELSQPPR
ncbi:MAG: methylmalonyl-CoA epimerase [bacterium]